MEQERIRELLNKYYEGGTSEEEEAQLKEYLSDPPLPSSAQGRIRVHPGNGPGDPGTFRRAFDERLGGMTLAGQRIASGGECCRICPEYSRCCRHTYRCMVCMF